MQSGSQWYRRGFCAVAWHHAVWFSVLGVASALWRGTMQSGSAVIGVASALGIRLVLSGRRGFRAVAGVALGLSARGTCGIRLVRKGRPRRCPRPLHSGRCT